MKLIYFFDHYVKPLMFKGMKYANPTPTGKLENGVSCIRQYDVNLWFYTVGSTTIAFDAGHLNYPNVEREFEMIGVRGEEIRHLFLTHSDVDHCGGIDRSGVNIFPNAEIYLGRGEEVYLDGRLHRFQRGSFKIKNCVDIGKEYQLLENLEVISVGGIRVQAIHVPGHTVGHCCYLIDNRILVSGDCLAINDDGGYGFFDFFNQFPDQNRESLRRLKKLLSGKELRMICTGHSGYRTDIFKAFLHIDCSATFSRRRPFDPAAPVDPFR